MPGLAADDPRHGKAGTYNNLGCRCDRCREAATAGRRRWAGTLGDRPSADIPHATASGYRNWGCRCEPCRKAARYQRLALAYQKGREAVGCQDNERGEDHDESTGLRAAAPAERPAW